MRHAEQMFLESYEVIQVKGTSPCLHDIRDQQKDAAAHGRVCLLRRQAMSDYVKGHFRLEERLRTIKDGTSQ